SNKPIREAEKITLSLSSIPKEIELDRVKAITPEIIELKFCANHELLEKIETVKGLLAHKQPNASLGDIFNELCDLGINALRKDGLRNKKQKQTELSKTEFSAAESNRAPQN